MHNAAFRACALALRYDAIDVAPEHLAATLRDLRASGFLGGNVTAPHKLAVVPLCEEIDPDARRIGAVNTLVLKDGVLRGGNTDGIGFRAAIDEAGLDLRGASVLVLGAGGSARAVVAAALDAGVARVVAVARRPERARPFAPEVLPWRTDALEDALARTDLLVNASTAGMEGEPAPCEPPLSRLPGHAVVLDLVYHPPETPLLALARRLGMRTLHGTRVLLHQGAASFRAWTGREAPLGVMEAALRAALAER
jgi:shikimate dehydrogenase